MIPEDRRSGYVRRWRFLYDSPIYRDLFAWRIYDYLETHANWKPKTWEGIVVQPGQFVTSRDHLSKATGLTVQQVRGALDRLKTRQTITIKTTKRYTLITLTNWEVEQTDEDAVQPEEQPDKQPGDNPVSTQSQPQLKNVISKTGKTKQEQRKKKKRVSVSTEPATEPRWKPDAAELQHVMDALNECGLQPPVDPTTTRDKILTHMKNVADFEKWLAYNSHNLAKARDWGLHVYYAKLWPKQREFAPEVEVVARKPKETCHNCKKPSGTNPQCDHCRWAVELRRAKITGKEPDYSKNPGLQLM